MKRFRWRWTHRGEPARLSAAEPTTAMSTRRSPSDVPAVVTGEVGFALGERRGRRSSLNRAAWRWLILAGGLSLLAALLNLLAGDPGTVLGVVLTLAYGAAAFAAVRFCWLDTSGRRFWSVWLAAGGLALLVAGTDMAGWVVASVLGFVFMLARRMHPYRHLTSTQRAWAFVAGLTALVLVAAASRWDVTEDMAHGLGVLLRTGHAARDVLAYFWLFSLLHLLLGMRLHFLRLRPKLAISAMLVGLVPLTLVVVLAVFALYGVLGGSRAMWAHETLDGWSTLVDAGVDLEGAVLPSGWAVTRGEVVAGDAPAPVPPWAPDLLERMIQSRRGPRSGTPPAAGEPGSADPAPPPVRDGAWVPADTAAYFMIERGIWLLRVRGLDTPSPRLAGWPVTTESLEHLARAVEADVEMHVESGGDGGITVGPGRDGGREPLLRARARERDADADFWHRPLYFGGALVEVIQPVDLWFGREAILLTVQLSVADLVNEYVRGEGNLNIAVVVGLGVLALLFLTIEVVAAFFGFRIAGGILGAVRALHEGTRRLAAGQLATRIDIPNEDELGDLAQGFNEMAAAVARGREVAVARERLLRELETARGIQQRLLPDDRPLAPGFEIVGVSVPTRQVGGDYYDFLPLGQGRLGLAVGDVSGKGMPAALLMSNLQASLQGQVIHPATVADVVARVNSLLVQSTDSHMFATFFYGVLDTQQSLFTYTNAGHNPPILLRAGGEVEYLQAGGLILGMLPGQEYRQETVTLGTGDVVVLYTDGITEAVARPSGAAIVLDEDDAADDDQRLDADGRRPAPTAAPEDPDADESTDDPSLMFGEGALLDVVRRSARLGAEGIKEAILAAVASHTAGTPQSDDITLVVVKRVAP
ncbi:MAG: SpoIIE family protein phosphatase [Candidatus Krumholzibacteriia bacterium]